MHLFGKKGFQAAHFLEVFACILGSEFVSLISTGSCHDKKKLRDRSAQDPPSPTRRLFLTQTSTVWENGLISNCLASTGFAAFLL